jgi:hypothetical protein
LAGFAAAVVAIFALAYGGGRLVGGFDGDDAAPARAGHGGAMAGMRGEADHGHGARTAGAEEAHGLAVADGGLRLVAPDRARAGETREFAFRIVDAHGATVRRYDLEHTKRLHLIVVRRDMTGFQHLHPRLGADGVWRTRLRLPAAGAYRVFADFTPTGGAATTLAGDVLVAGAFDPRPLAEASPVAAVDGYDVALRRSGSGELSFSVTRDGRPVAVQPHLGADGHLVALRDGDLAYLHVHPMRGGGARGQIKFMASYPSAGRYRLFLQFRAGGRVHTAAFTQEVGR